MGIGSMGNMGKILTGVLLPLILVFFGTLAGLYVLFSLGWTLNTPRDAWRKRKLPRWHILFRRASGILPVSLGLVLYLFFTNGVLWTDWGAPRATDWGLRNLPVSYQVQSLGGELITECWPTRYVWYVALKLDAFAGADSLDKAVGQSLTRVVQLAQLKNAKALHLEIVDSDGFLRMGFILWRSEYDTFLGANVVSVSALGAWESTNFKLYGSKDGLGIRTNMELSAVSYGWNTLRQLWASPCTRSGFGHWQDRWLYIWDRAIAIRDLEAYRLEQQAIKQGEQVQPGYSRGGGQMVPY